MEEKKHTHSCCSEEHDHHGCSCGEAILEDLDEEKYDKKHIIIKIIALTILMAIGLYLDFTKNSLADIVLITVAILSGYEIIYLGLKSLTKGKVTINFLVTIASIGAFLLGASGEGAVVIFLYSIAEYLEDYAIDNSKKSIKELLKMAPNYATLKLDEKKIKVEDLEIGDIVIVKPGEKIPIDGEIIKGETSINQSAITGESKPVFKNIGDKVYSSTINEDGYIEIKVTVKSNATLFSKIIQMVKESESKKADIDLFIDKFSQYYTPVIILIAILTATIPPLVLKQAFETWIYKSLVLLVISCPCALAISTPISMISAISSAAKKGLIIRGGKFIEELNNIKIMLFDKTGTLTEGKLKIAEFKTIGNNKKEDLIKIACSLEKLSSHPIANAFKDYEKNKKVETLEVDSFKNIAGKGIIGKINGEEYIVANKLLFDKSIFNEKDIADVGNTIVFIGKKDELKGYVILEDKIREDAEETIEMLRSKNIKTYMLTGDDKKTAEEISEKLNLDRFYSNLLPEDKLKILEELETEHIAMIGDGINDAPSLSKANIGIAMGGTGTDVAIETADIVLMQDNLSNLEYLLRLAEKTMNIIKANIGISVTVKALFAVLAILGLMNLWGAVLIGDMGLTFLVIINAIRIANIS